MKHLIILFTFFLSCNSFAQPNSKLALINEAELAIVDENLEKAANIYDQLFLQKDELWAQDLYNAAVVEMKLGSFEYAKKYLNELAKRGIKLENLETIPVFEEIKNGYDWQSYKLVYDQLQTYSSKTNQYTEFIGEMEAAHDSLLNLSYEISYIPIRTSTKDSTIISFEGKKLYAIPNSELTDALQDTLLAKIDSVQSLPSRRVKIKAYRDRSFEVLEIFKSFFEKNDWPFETHFNNVRVYSVANPMNLIAMNLLSLPDLGSSSSELIETKTSNEHYFKPLFNGADSLIISKQVMKAVKMGQLKPMVALQLLDYSSFLDFQNFKIFEIRISESENCRSINGKFFIKQIPLTGALEKKYHVYAQSFGIENHEDLIKKAIYISSQPESFSFNTKYQMELSSFDSCENAEQFIEDAMPFDRSE